MKTLLIALLSLATTFITAQNTVVWVGGTPGKMTNWNEARNWSNHRVPDAFSFVIIKNQNTGHNSQPVINGVAEVGAIEIQSGATLTVKEGGEIMIDGSDFYTEGITVYGGKVVNDGVINLKNIEGLTADSFRGKVLGKGIIFINGIPADSNYLANN